MVVSEEIGIRHRVAGGRVGRGSTVEDAPGLWETVEEESEMQVKSLEETRVERFGGRCAPPKETKSTSRANPRGDIWTERRRSTT